MRFYSENLGISESAFVLLRDLVHQKIGIFFSNSQIDVFSDKISSRVIENGFDSFMDYYMLLKYDEQADEEWQELINAITVNESYFWREFDQIEAFVKHILPAYLKQNPGRKIKIWSAACSTGEEPYTLAMVLNEEGLLQKYPIEIWASDADSQVLQKAQNGQYRERSFRAIPKTIKAKYFRLLKNNLWEISSEIKSQVQFRHTNLNQSEDFDFYKPIPFIFCRNVFIYFSDKAIKQVSQSFYNTMPDRGWLFVGVSESLLRIQSDFGIHEIGNAYVYTKGISDENDPELEK